MSAILESTVIDEWFHTSSHDNPADGTDTRRINSEALEEIDWMKGTNVLTTKCWPFKPELEVLFRIFLIGRLKNLNACVKKIAHLKPPNHFLPRKFSSFPKLQKFAVIC